MADKKQKAAKEPGGVDFYDFGEHIPATPEYRAKMVSDEVKAVLAERKKKLEAQRHTRQ